MQQLKDEQIDELLSQIEKMFILFNSANLFSQELTLSELRVLRCVGDFIKCNMKDIIDSLSIPPSTATGIVDRLVKNNFLIRYI